MNTGIFLIISLLVNCSQSQALYFGDNLQTQLYLKTLISMLNEIDTNSKNRDLPVNKEYFTGIGRPNLLLQIDLYRKYQEAQRKEKIQSIINMINSNRSKNISNNNIIRDINNIYKEDEDESLSRLLANN
jgi:hypothetical protein